MAEERKHTPGQWTIEEYGDEDCPALVIHRDSETRVCFMATPGSHGDPEIIEANARLIAAAPDLLAALQELMQIREWSIRAGGMDGPLPRDVIVKFAEMQIPAVDRARAAIKRATEG